MQGQGPLSKQEARASSQHRVLDKLASRHRTSACRRTPLWCRWTKEVEHAPLCGGVRIDCFKVANRLEYIALMFVYMWQPQSFK